MVTLSTILFHFEKITGYVVWDNRKTFASANSVSKPSTSKKLHQDKKSLSEGHKRVDLTRVRGFDIHEIFKYDFVESSYLFDDDGLMTKAHDKYLLTKELEECLQPNDMIRPDQWEDKETVYLIDVMSVLHKVKTKDIETFGEFCQ